VELAPLLGTRRACRALGLARAGLYRRRRAALCDRPRPLRPSPQRALSRAEREAVLAELHSERFVDAAPAAVVATLLDEGRYLASERTMYRILRAAGEGRERRDQLAHPPYARPELLASRPNELWSFRYHQAARPRHLDLLPALRDPRRLQPLRRRLDVRPSGVGRACAPADRRDDGQAPGSARWPHRPRRPRFLDDLQAGGAPAVRPRSHQEPLAAPHRQPTTPTPRPSSRRSSTGPASRTGSAPSTMRAPSAATSSAGTTRSTATPALG
jgi:hypothetical protein